MKRFLLSVFAFSLFAFFSAAAQPKLTIVGGDTYDWKEVSPKDSPLKAKIKLKNDGNETLLITKVKPACGCTYAPLDKKELVPGDVATLDVTLRVGSSSRPLTKTITITSNDPTKAKRILYLKAKVVNPIEVSNRRYFNFKDLKVGYESAETLTITNQTKKKLTLSHPEIQTEDGTVKLNLTKRKVLKPGESFELTCKVKPNKSGRFNAKITIETTNKEYPILKLRAKGKVQESEIFNNK